MTQQQRFHGVTEGVAAGAAAGFAGGFFMMMFLVLDAGGLGMGYPTPLLDIAASVSGPRALVGGAGVAIVGLLIHFAVSIAWGALFGALVQRDTGFGPALSYGLVAALIALLSMTFIVLPLVDPTMAARIRLFWGSWCFAHVLFGIGLSLAPPLWRKLWRSEPLESDATAA